MKITENEKVIPADKKPPKQHNQNHQKQQQKEPNSNQPSSISLKSGSNMERRSGFLMQLWICLNGCSEYPYSQGQNREFFK